MKLSTILVTALAATAEAIVHFTNSNFDVTAGTPFELTWTDAVGPVTITLKNGPQLKLQDVMVIDSNDTGTSFSWTPPATLPTDTYAFEIKDSKDRNYSIQFVFQGTTSSSSSSSSSSSTSSVSTTTSTSVTTSTSSSHSSSSTSSRTSTTSSATTTKSSPTSAPSNTNDALRQKSPLALVLVTVAALLYFN